jgi:hypothetical protein
MKKKISVPCSDWMLGWGFGNNKIGKLVFDIETREIYWRGVAQGRHGQIWQRFKKAILQIDGEYITIDGVNIDGKVLKDAYSLLKSKIEKL